MINIDKVKTHVKTYKTTYIVGATCLTIGVLSGIALIRTVDISVVGNNNQVVGKAKNVTQVVVEMVERSTPSKPVHLVGTNLYFNSLNEAARETGHSLSKLSRHINGHLPDIDGDVFKLLEPAS
jgi:hypothetical protein